MSNIPRAPPRQVIHAPRPEPFIVNAHAFADVQRPILATDIQWNHFHTPPDPTLTPYRSASQNSDESLRLKRSSDVQNMQLLVPLDDDRRSEEAVVEHIVNYGPVAPITIEGRVNGMLQPFCFFPTFVQQLRSGRMTLKDVAEYADRVPSVHIPIHILRWYWLHDKLDVYEQMFINCSSMQARMANMKPVDQLSFLLEHECVVHIGALLMQ